MRKRLQLGPIDLLELLSRARAAQPHASEVWAVLGSRFRPEVAEYYADLGGAVTDLIAEVRRLQGELQHTLRAAVTRVDDAGTRRGGDVTEAGKARRRKGTSVVPKRRVDADHVARKGRVR